MHLSLSTPISLLFLPLLISLPTLSISYIHVPNPFPSPVPSEIFRATSEFPITISTFSSGAAFEDERGETRVYYQADDGAIRQIARSNRSSYSLSVNLIPIGKARQGTPLAVTGLPPNGGIRLYYISPKNQLQEYIYDNGWKDGALNSANIFTSEDSQLLVVYLGTRDPKLRVGYVPIGGYSEVAWDGSKWIEYFSPLIESIVLK